MKKMEPGSGTGNGFWYLIIAKGARTFVSGMVSVLTPIYLAILGHTPLEVGLAIMVVVLGNVFSNIALSWYGNVIGRKRALLFFSCTMTVSGIVLASTTQFAVMLIGLFVGNISTTGTEAGPFQSVETGILPRIVGENRASRAFGIYNLVGYGASSFGAFASSIPSYFGDVKGMIRILFLVFGLVGLVLLLVYTRFRNIESGAGGRQGLGALSEEERADVKRLSLLFSVDAFGGGLVSQSVLSYWFFVSYGVSLSELGLIFLVANIITALSIYGASVIAGRLGNLKTMVYTHVISNFFLVMVPLAGSLTWSVAFLFLRQSLSQMDVPTRQAFIADIFGDSGRVTANAITNTARSLASVPGAPLAGFLFALGLLPLPIIAAGLSKIGFDVAIFSAYRRRAE